MIYNYRKTLLVVVLLFVSFPLAAQTPNFDKLKQKFDSGQVFEALYTHEFTDSYTGEVNVSEGNIWIEKEGYKLKSEDQTLVVDGETSKVYEGARNRLIISEYDPETDDFAPSRMLNGVDSTYTISETSNGNTSEVTLKSDDAFAIFRKVEILLNQDQYPLEITAYDVSDNVIVTTFRGGSFVEMNESIFSLKVPGNAEVVDMRY
ncbi:MAG: outer membrane lipoprotein carrier protein LolA [Balneolaceae bacterium]|nr:outer membrane lipoprotein carrier protein LolA [Balneolaceae bacterium]